MSQPIAIIGMGCQLPGAADLPQFWQLLKRGETHFQEIPRDRWDHNAFFDPKGQGRNRSYVRKIAALDDITSFASRFFDISHRQARIMDPQQRLFLEATRSALEDAGYANRRFSSNTGVYVGISTSEHHHLVGLDLHLSQALAGDFGRVMADAGELLGALLERIPVVGSYTMTGQMLNMAAANVARAFDFTGPAFAVDSACSSGLSALVEAVLHLRSGLCDGAVVGGVYVTCTPDNLVCFSRIGALSPTDSCRPFDRRADGFVLGEGVGVLVLKRLDDALAAGDPIWAVIRGVGVSNDGRAESPTSPRQLGQTLAMERAYRDADIAPQSIGLFEAHGTGTPVGDKVEVAALAEILNRASTARDRPAYLGSAKANIGHTIAASGIAGAIKASLSLTERLIVPQAAYEEEHPEFDLAKLGLTIPRQLIPWEDGEMPRRAAVSAFGFGGTNVHVVLEEPTAGARRHCLSGDSSERTEPTRLRFSAPTPELLREYLGTVRAQLQTAPLKLSDLAATLAARRPDGRSVTVTACNHTELLELLDLALDGTPDARIVPDEALDIAVPSTDGAHCALPASPLERQRFWLVEPTDPTPVIVPEVTSPQRPHVDMDPAELEQRILVRIGELLERPVEELSLGQSLAEDLGMDSLMAAELSCDVESEVGVEIPLSLFSSETTIGELIDYLTRTMAAEETAPAPGPTIDGRCDTYELSLPPDLPQLADHQIDGRAVLPLAAMIDLAVAAGARLGVSVPVTLRQIEVIRPLVVSDAASGGIRVTARAGEKTDRPESIQVEIHHTPRDSESRLVCRAAIEAAINPLPPVVPAESERAPQLAMETFYAEHTFHGPQMQAVVQVDGVSEIHARGRLRSASTGPLLGNVDILAVDGALQLCAFLLAEHDSRRLLPVEVAECRVLASPRPGQRLSAIARFDEDERAQVDVLDEQGNPLVQLRGLRGQ